jgi:hypothetical protein
VWQGRGQEGGEEEGRGRRGEESACQWLSDEAFNEWGNMRVA